MGDLFKNAADTVEDLYKNTCLSPLNQQWNRLISTDMEQSGFLRNIEQQTDFYRKYIKPIVQNGNRVFVIISDALRFEVAQELCKELTTGTNGTAQISAMQAVFPSITKLGMAAPLPHDAMTFHADLQHVCCDCNGDQLCTENTKQRDAILKKRCAKNTAVTYQELLAMKREERRERVSGAECVYIYHNKIDAVGDKAATETQVFEACEDTVEELKNLVKLVVSTMNGSNILITADHGFLYTYQPLAEYDKANSSCISGDAFVISRRYMLTDDVCAADGMLSVCMKRYAVDIKGYTPYAYVRMQKSGGGMNYVHGGVSLQECVVPVITFQNVRTSSKRFVEIQNAQLQLLNIDRKLHNSIFSLNFYQTKPVKDKVIQGEYEIYFVNTDGMDISDRQTVIADKIDMCEKERIYRVRFTLKGMPFDRTAAYYLLITDKQRHTELSRTKFEIQIAFTNDFDFKKINISKKPVVQTRRGKI